MSQTSNPADAMRMILAAWAEERGVSPEVAETIATRVLAPYLAMPISRPSTQKIIDEFLHEVQEPDPR